MNEKILEYKTGIARITISAIMVILSFLNISISGFDLSWIAILLCAVPIIYNSILALIYEHDIKADILVSIAIIASILIGEVFAAGEIAVIMEIGGLLEEITVSTTQFRIEKLVDLQPNMATLIKGDDTQKVKALDLKANDIIKVVPGETIPADGIIIKGTSTINQAILTGESLPVDKTANDEVFAGTINNFGTLIIKVTVDGYDNSLQKLINLIENISTDDNKIIKQADKWANIIVAASFMTAILTWLYTGEITRAVTVLVVFCPCALVLATPTAIVAAIGNLSKYGILVKDATKLETLYQIKHILFDKTGTITTGIPQVIDEVVLANDKLEFLKITASVESYSEHPLAKAITDYYKQTYPDNKLYEIDEFEMELSMGVKAKVNNKECLIGNSRLFEKYNIEIPAVHETNNKISASTVVYTYYGNEFMGFLLIQDTPKNGMENTISTIKYNGYNPVLLTGDNKEVATDIAQKLNVENVVANCLPETKLEYVEDSQRELKQVMMVGDGINDALAMKKADISIAMGDIGSDITIDCADLVFINDDLNYLPYLLHISKKTLNTIDIGIAFAMALNILAVILGMLGVLTPVTGALIHNIGSVLVIIFAALIFKEKPDRYIEPIYETI